MDGEAITVVELSEIEGHSEFYAIVRIIANYRLFGALYWTLVGRFFQDMPRDSGVFVSCNVRSSRIRENFLFPGDVDVLVIPYFGDKILADRILAIEVKVVRATFEKQGKSPNKLGFTQAEGLVRAGFPYVGVVHAITSDRSPLECQREFGLATVGKGDTISEIGSVIADPLPIDLLERALGRLHSRRGSDKIGIACVYTGDSRISHDGNVYDGSYFPDGFSAEWCPEGAGDLMPSVVTFFNQNPDEFLDIPKWRDKPC